jgi:hypothetical protein
MRTARLPISALAALALAVLLPSTGSAQRLSGQLTVDNSFAAYLSSSATVQGTLISSGTNWQQTYSFSDILLTPGQDYYLQVRGTDVGVISAFLGSFALTGTEFAFANGTQRLTTNINDWFVSTTAFGVGLASPISEGANGVSPWGVRPGIERDASWIWSDDRCINCTRYFQTRIGAVVATIPEPASFGLLAIGATALLIVHRRRRHA